MILLNIKLFADFREICGDKVVSIDMNDAQPISSVLQALIQQFPKMKEELFTEQGELQALVHVFVNGKNIIHLDGLQTLASGSDQIALFPPVAGG